MKRNYEKQAPHKPDRDNITPSYLHALRVMALKATVIRLRKKPWTA
jgi:hypothetical protein